MPIVKLKNYLDANHVKYNSVVHSQAYSAKEVSHITNTPEGELAKTVIVNLGHKMVMLVLPSAETIDFKSLRKSLRATDVSLASEKEFSKVFPDCELGAMPPFGNLYNMEVYVDEHLANNREIACNAGTHSEVIRLSYKDFDKLVHPKKIAITH